MATRKQARQQGIDRINDAVSRLTDAENWLSGDAAEISDGPMNCADLLAAVSAFQQGLIQLVNNLPQ